jgi:hypothetical protein
LTLAVPFTLVGRLPGLPKSPSNAEVTMHSVYSKIVVHVSGPPDRAMVFHGMHFSEMIDRWFIVKAGWRRLSGMIGKRSGAFRRRVI